MTMGTAEKILNVRLPIDPARFIAESKNPFALSLSKGFDKLSPNGFMNNSCRINSQLHGQLEQLVQIIRMQHIAQLWPRQPNWSKKTI